MDDVTQTKENQQCFIKYLDQLLGTGRRRANGRLIYWGGTSDDECLVKMQVDDYGLFVHAKTTHPARSEILKQLVAKGRELNLTAVESEMISEEKD